MSGRIPKGHVGVVDPPPHPLHERWTCLEHGPTVRVLWTAGMRCPLCESYERERALREALKDMERRSCECDQTGGLCAMATIAVRALYGREM